jgi:hypothetical protein
MTGGKRTLNYIKEFTIKDHTNGWEARISVGTDPEKILKRKMKFDELSG